MERNFFECALAGKSAFVTKKFGGMFVLTLSGISILLAVAAYARTCDFIKRNADLDFLISKARHFFIAHVRKLALVIINSLLNRPSIFSVFGLINRKFHFINSVFLAYPAVESYANAYCYKWHIRKYQWKPFITGIFCQNGKWGLMMAIPNSEEEFYQPANRKALKLLVARATSLRDLLGTSQMSFAGILPSLLNSLDYLDSQSEAEATIEAILQAEEVVRRQVAYPEDVPLIILGKGFIGSKLISRFIGRPVFGVDVNDGWPHELKDRKAILINLTRRAVLKNYVNLCWPALVILNEVYPEPSRREIESLRRIGCRVYHIVGVKAKSFPSFPGAYKGGIPCCAAWKSEQMKVLVRDLS